MTLRNSKTEFGSFAKWLHWLVASGICALLWLGFRQAGMESGPERTDVRALHASIALIVFVLMVVRIVWRMANVVPAHADGVPGWQKIAARRAHWGLYIAVFLQIIAGQLTIATGGDPLPFFGVFSIPLPIAENRAGHELWEEIHKTVWIVILALLVVHIVGAVYNHFVLRNDVLRRMTVGLRNGGSENG